MIKSDRIHTGITVKDLFIFLILSRSLSSVIFFQFLSSLSSRLSVSGVFAFSLSGLLFSLIALLNV